MIRTGWKWRWVLLGAVLTLAAGGCRSEKKVGMDELLSIRSEALDDLQRDKLAEAEAGFRKLVDLAPDDPFGHAKLGLTYLRAGKFDEAEPELRRARELDPSNVETGLTLARLYAVTDRGEKARALLDELRKSAPRDPHVLYALAQLDAGAPDGASRARYAQRLRDVLALTPTNVAVRVELAQVLLRGGQADSVVHQLEEIRSIPPAAPAEARRFLESSIELLRAGQTARARSPFERFVREMRTTIPYQTSLEEVKWVEGPRPGRPTLTFVPEDYLSTHGLPKTAAAESVHFTDETDDAGLFASGGSGAPGEPGALATGDVDGDGLDDLFTSSDAPGGPEPALAMYRFVGGQALDVTTRSGITLPSGARFATFADYDNDGWLDLFVIDGGGLGHLYRNRGNVTFEDVTAKAGVGETHGARTGAFVDVDHDGDLDLLLAGDGPRTVYRNNLDGTFTDATAAFGLAGGGGARDVRYADFDGEGHIDVFIAREKGGGLLFLNHGAQRFSDATAASGLGAGGGAGAAAVGDFNNDGFLDIFVGSADGGGPELWLNRGDATFTRDRRSDAALRRLRSLHALAADFVDYDNDGWLDLVVAGTPTASGGRGLLLFRNQGDGTFTDRSELLPPVGPASGVAVADVDRDGDQDVLAEVPGGARLLRNDGGNARLAVNVELKALRTGSGKNNDFGIGARLELRAGELHETRVVTGRATHFGLGPHLKADVLRVVWPNGVPQTLYFPGTDQDVLEAPGLKASCAFLYTWNGERFDFVTDVMWRSALGMPLGLMGGGTAFAPAGASQEYLRIPGSALKPKDGHYLLQLTEELWETAYVDRVRLLTVDHPDSVEVFVDERFVPPGPLKLRLYQAVRPHPPLSATDGQGTDLLPALREKDDVYVSNLKPTRYQGIVEPHDLVMDLGPDAGRPGSILVLRGWIYPTDASINVALSQQSELKPEAPSLQVRDARGRWKTVVPFLSFPSGKNKTMVIDLAGKFPTADHHVRIRTNMQIYWDQAFVARDASESPTRTETLAPVSADLHYRGFSRTYRKGGRYGPQWFAYDDVSTKSPWLPIHGSFTRYGNVLPLLGDSDDMYIVMGMGDETTVKFDAAGADSLPPGWTRDFLLYTDGWIKDSDLNTAHGTTVGPLPFHAIERYPYAPGESYPKDAAHQRYLHEYNTRLVR
ncbi:MAG TPA: FG-GAP-like repeat-containing protein [Longimicrobiaceae bacterium]|nr:FG-GAP-like repeat-containing protein [Longimicrobiaceae bacterium]